MKRVLVPIAHGSEEIEAVSIIDTLRRAEVEVVVAAVGKDLKVKCSRGVHLVADCLLSDLKDVASSFDAIAIPGGMPGAQSIADVDGISKILNELKENRKWISAICAAPAIVLAKHGILTESTPATCFPADKMRSMLPNASKAAERVVVDTDARLITSQGPGTALEFAVELAARLVGADRTADVRSKLLVKE